MIVVDAGVFVAALFPNDRHHEVCRAFLSDPGDELGVSALVVVGTGWRGKSSAAGDLSPAGTPAGPAPASGHGWRAVDLAVSPGHAAAEITLQQRHQHNAAHSPAGEVDGNVDRSRRLGVA